MTFCVSGNWVVSPVWERARSVGAGYGVHRNISLIRDLHGDVDADEKLLGDQKEER